MKRYRPANDNGKLKTTRSTSSSYEYGESVTTVNQKRLRHLGCSSCTLNDEGNHRAGCIGHMVYSTPQGRMFHKIAVHSFIINPQAQTDHVYVASDLEDRYVLKALKAASFINPKARFRSFRIDSNLVVYYKDVPTLKLEIF